MFFFQFAHPINKIRMFTFAILQDPYQV
jgi:hypothetical protein